MPGLDNPITYNAIKRSAPALAPPIEVYKPRTYDTSPPTPEKKKEPNPIKNFAIGGVSGMTATTFVSAHLINILLPKHSVMTYL